MDKGTGDEWITLFELAMKKVLGDGIEKDRQDVLAYRLSRVNTGGTARSVVVDWGMVVEGADYDMQETRIGTLSFNAIDFWGMHTAFPFGPVAFSLWRSTGD